MLEQQLNRLLSGDVKRCVVALSGGADSVALLHLIVEHRLPVPVIAIHINHGLQEEADSWQEFCEEFCTSLQVNLTSIVVEVSKKGSVEENARNARYAAFENFLESGDLLLLGHHSNDQVETVVLNLMRGSDAFGVRGMPIQRNIGKAMLYRPLLGLSREDIINYCRTHELRWIEDASNQDESLDRNYLRHLVLPQLASRFPSMDKALLNAVDRDLKTSLLVGEYAQADLRVALSANGGVRLDVVAKFSELRLVNLLRQYLGGKRVPYPSGRQLRECARVMRGSRDDAAPSLRWASFELVRHKGCMYLLHELPGLEQQSVLLHGREAIEYGGGILTMVLVEGQGICLESDLELRSRLGGESIQLQQRRSLKNVFQENDIPVWLRTRLPLVFEQGELIAVPAITTWNTHGIYAENRKPGAGQSGWVFSFEIHDRV